MMMDWPWYGTDWPYCLRKLDVQWVQGSFTFAKYFPSVDIDNICRAGCNCGTAPLCGPTTRQATDFIFSSTRNSLKRSEVSHFCQVSSEFAYPTHSGLPATRYHMLSRVITRVHSHDGGGGGAVFTVRLPLGEDVREQ